MTIIDGHEQVAVDDAEAAGADQRERPDADDEQHERHDDPPRHEGGRDAQPGDAADEDGELVELDQERPDAAGTPSAPFARPSSSAKPLV
jgi:hypothetical protein